MNAEREEALSRFSEDMRAKLTANERKGTWADTPMWTLILRLKEEMRELTDALIERQGTVPDEAADVANYAMMIADNWRRQNGGKE